VPHKEQVCTSAKDQLKKAAADVLSVSYAVQVAEALGCGEKASSEVMVKLEAGVESGVLEEIHAALSALAALKEHKHG